MLYQLKNCELKQKIVISFTLRGADAPIAIIVLPFVFFRVSYSKAIDRKQGG